MRRTRPANSATASKTRACVRISFAIQPVSLGRWLDCVRLLRLPDRPCFLRRAYRARFRNGDSLPVVSVVLPMVVGSYRRDWRTQMGARPAGRRRASGNSCRPHIANIWADRQARSLPRPAEGTPRSVGLVSPVGARVASVHTRRTCPDAGFQHADLEISDLARTSFHPSAEEVILPGSVENERPVRRKSTEIS